MKPLYKFVGDKAAVKSIARGSLKFTQIDDLNDLSELIEQMDRDAVSASLTAIRSTGYTKEQFEWLGCQEALLRRVSPETRILSRPATIKLANATLKLPIYNNLDYMEKQLRQTIRLIRSRIGVLSLTERYDFLPMWAHYGALAKGYVICFDDLNREFPNDPSGSLDVLKKVNYVESVVGMTHDPATQDNLFFSKFNDWSYECEWRVVRPLSDCRPSDDRKMHLWDIDRSVVTEVICGWNVPHEEIMSLKAELSDINPNLKMRRASLERGRVRLPEREAT